MALVGSTLLLSKAATISAGLQNGGHAITALMWMVDPISRSGVLMMGGAVAAAAHLPPCKQCPGDNLLQYLTLSHSNHWLLA